jgi:hypothetical protein
MDEIRRLLASPDVIVGSVAAVTEAGSLVVASASGSQLTGYAGGAARVIWVVGAQKVVPDLGTALRRIEDHCLPLESDRAIKPYGRLRLWGKSFLAVLQAQGTWLMRTRLPAGSRNAQSRTP